LQFTRQGDKVSYDQWDSYPIFMLGCKFQTHTVLRRGQAITKTEKKELKLKIKKQFFYSLIWSTYRRNFEQGLLSDMWSQKYLSQYLKNTNADKALTTDMNWGCTLRVG
jgi:hypothetical protein